MADYNTSYISQITLSSGTYDLKDAWAREKLSGLTGAMHYVGVSTTNPATEGATIDGKTTGWNSGDVCIYTPSGKESCEYVYNGSSWQEFGSTGSLKALAFKDSASGTVSLSGTATGTLSMNAQTHTHTVKSSDVSVSVSYLPEGTISGTAVTLTTVSGGASKLKTAGSVTAGSAPTLGTAITADDITSWSAGSLPTLGTEISIPNVTSVGSTPTLGTAITADDITSWSAGKMATIDTSKFNGGTATTVSVTAGSDASLTGGKVASWSASVSGETLSFSWSSNTLQSLSGGKATKVSSTTGTPASLSTGFYTAGTAPSLSFTAKSIPNVTSVGSTPTLGTAISVPNVTGVGTLPSLSYTARSIPNVTSVGSATKVTLPTFDSVTIATGVSSVTDGTFTGKAGTVTGSGSASVVLNTYTGTPSGSFTNGKSSVSGSVTVS